MITKLLKQKFGISAQEKIAIGSYEACKAKNTLYVLVPIGQIDKEEINELDLVSKHFLRNGDSRVCQFMRTQEGENIIDWEGQRFCVLSQQPMKEQTSTRIGRKLAKFHYRGRTVSFALQRINRIGMWKQFWEKRLDQMEKVWNDHLVLQPENEFDRMFVESFPYYMGIAENAIQYLMDTEVEDQPLALDSGTVCHERFCSTTWGEQIWIKNPFDWVFDHCARDLAEWTRERYFNNIKTSEQEIRQFYSDYKSVAAISSFGWRLLYARMLFPLHFFECVERYFIAASEQERLEKEEQLAKYLKQSGEHENFLSSFYQLTEVPIRKYRIPELEWLRR